MLKRLSFLVVIIAGLMVVAQSNAQSIYFCEDVTNDGYPVRESGTFNIGSGGGYMKVLVKLPYEVACYSVRYEIYRNGNYNSTIYQDTERSWIWFWKEITFYDAGSYDVYVYDSYDYLLTSGSVRINWR